MSDWRKPHARRWTFALALPALMLILTTGCAPQVIELRGGPTDCAWAQSIYLGEDSIHALSDAEMALRNAGKHEQAFRVRMDRKAIGDHNKLFERNCGAKP